MFRVLGKLFVYFVIITVFLRLIPPLPISSVVTQKQDLFTVTGEGKVTVIPDTAVVSLGALINQPTVVAAQSRANTIINDVTLAVKAQGVADKDIKTSGYSVYPQYDFREGTNRITGYQVNVNLTITVRDMSKLNSVIDSSTAKGANTVSGISLTVDEDRQKELLQEARDLAIDEAKAKAASLSRSAGIQLVRVVNVQESGTTPPQPGPMLAEKAVGFGGGGDTQIQAGSTDIISIITLSYETR